MQSANYTKIQNRNCAKLPNKAKNGALTSESAPSNLDDAQS